MKDVSQENILDCLNWKDTIKNNLKKHIETIYAKIDELEKLLEEGIDFTKNDRDLWHYKQLLSALDILSINELERRLLINKTLIVSGDAGTGKTHILSEKAIKLIENDQLALMLLGQNFITNDYIEIQIPHLLGLNVSLDELLNNLESYGENNACVIPILIDAINESPYKIIWKQGLGNLIKKIEDYNYLKLIISYRNGYENLVIDNAVKCQLDDAICKLNHYGFIDNSFDAIRKYLDNYDIPFSPSYLLDYEFTNPLFLKLYCKTYNGEEVDIKELFERIIQNANSEVCSILSLDSSRNYIKILLNEVCNTFLKSKNAKNISLSDLMKLDFWETYGLSNEKIIIVNQLIKNGILNNFARDDIEYCYFGYNLLEDYLIGKAVIDLCTSKDEIQSYITSDILTIEDGSITNYNFIGVFGACANLYYEKYHEEFINSILELCEDENSKNSIIETFLDFYKIRTGNCIDADFFIEFVRENEIDRDTVFGIIFNNALKPNNSLNAEFLHTILLNKTIAERDYLWTTYINMFTIQDNRIYYIIDLFAKGNINNSSNQKVNNLTVILFTWILTSSNIVLRDTASRALIEILKCDFELWQRVLELFENVNDPYIIQRLYAIVFGACTKKNNLYQVEFKELVLYVYNTVFDKEFVYPDILLRDYAKLIIELYVHEFGTVDEITIERIYPPYNSEPLPIIENSPYKQYRNYNSGQYYIISSMHPNTIPGMYGDFGRYIFESCLNDFESVDIQNAYYYALQYIFEELKLEVNIRTGKHEEVHQYPLLLKDTEGNVLFQQEDRIYKRPVSYNLGYVKQAFLRYLYESQYDGTLESSITIDFPCKDIIEYFNLKQKEYDGYFYDGETLVAFDSKISSTGYGLLIRKDYLSKYLVENKKKLFWTNIGEKQFFLGDSNQMWQEWSGFSYLTNEKICGNMAPTEKNNR